MKFGVECNFPLNREILIAAIKWDRPNIFEYALNNGATLDKDAIEIATKRRCLEVLKFACTTRYKDDVCMMEARYGYYRTCLWTIGALIYYGTGC